MLPSNNTIDGMCMLSRSVMSNSLWLHGLAKLLFPWDFPGKNTGAGCQFPLQGIFPTQGSKPGLLYLLHWQVDSLPRQGPETLICVSWLVSHTPPRGGYSYWCYFPSEDTETQRGQVSWRIAEQKCEHPQRDPTVGAFPCCAIRAFAEFSLCQMQR